MNGIPIKMLCAKIPSNEWIFNKDKKIINIKLDLYGSDKWVLIAVIALMSHHSMFPACIASHIKYIFIAVKNQ